MINIRVFLSKNFQFFGGEISIYLNRRVFVMLLVYPKVSMKIVSNIGLKH